MNKAITKARNKTKARKGIVRYSFRVFAVFRVFVIAFALEMELQAMPSVRWTAERMDQLENAARRGLRVALSRRGTEYIVVALRLASDEQHEAFVGWLPMTGEELTFRLHDIESFQVIE